jgi:hypothetical protein
MIGNVSATNIHQVKFAAPTVSTCTLLLQMRQEPPLQDGIPLKELYSSLESGEVRNPNNKFFLRRVLYEAHSTGTRRVVAKKSRRARWRPVAVQQPGPRRRRRSWAVTVRRGMPGALYLDVNIPTPNRTVAIKLWAHGRVQVAGATSASVLPALGWMLVQLLEMYLGGTWRWEDGRCVMRNLNTHMTDAFGIPLQLRLHLDRLRQELEALEACPWRQDQCVQGVTLEPEIVTALCVRYHWGCQERVHKPRRCNCETVTLMIHSGGQISAFGGRTPECTGAAFRWLHGRLVHGHALLVALGLRPVSTPITLEEQVLEEWSLTAA